MSDRALEVAHYEEVAELRQRIAELEAECEENGVQARSAFIQLRECEKENNALKTALSESCDEERARCRAEGGYPCELASQLAEADRIIKQDADQLMMRDSDIKELVAGGFEVRMKKRATKAERAHMSRVADIGCLICGGPSEVHHIRANVGMGQRASYDETIPLCAAHHRTGGYGVAIHAGKREWERLFGTETDLLKETRRILDALDANWPNGTEKAKS